MCHSEKTVSGISRLASSCKAKIFATEAKPIDFKGALRIAKDFRLGITKEQSSTMTRAYECMVHGRFYKQLGYDLDEKIAEGVKILVGLYGRSEAHDLHQPVQ